MDNPFQSPSALSTGITIIIHVLLLSIPWVNSSSKPLTVQEIPIKLTTQLSIQKPIPKETKKKIKSKRPKKQRVKKSSKVISGKSTATPPPSPPPPPPDPMPIKAIKKIYPKEALSYDWKGTIIVDLVINKKGKVTKTHLIQSTGISRFDEIIQTILKTQLFKKNQPGKFRYEAKYD